MLRKCVPEKKGFCIVERSKNYACVFLTHEAQYACGEFRKMKRHNDSDEVFVLIEGRAKLLTMVDGVYSETPLEKGIAYVVETATWHALAVSEDALLFVTENHDVIPEHSDVLTLDPPYFLSVDEA